MIDYNEKCNHCGVIRYDHDMRKCLYSECQFVFGYGCHFCPSLDWLEIDADSPMWSACECDKSWFEGFYGY